MNLQMSEDRLIDSPGHGGAQGFAVEGKFSLLARSLRIRSLSHIARLLKRPRRTRWLGWESGIFSLSGHSQNPYVRYGESFTALPAGGRRVVVHPAGPRNLAAGPLDLLDLDP